MPGLGHVTGREHIQDAFHQRLPNEEVAYLALHIQRVIEKT
jgi:transcriptional antiterminator